MGLIRLDPFMFVFTPLGEAEAHFVNVDSRELSSEWGCFQVETKENWWWPNFHVRLMYSVSAGRDGDHSPIHLDEGMKRTLAPHILRHKLSPFYDWANEYFRGTPNRDMEHG